MLLPYLLAGLGSAVVPDYRAATYMIVGHLAARATFTADLASGVGPGGAYLTLRHGLLHDAWVLAWLAA